MTTSQPSPANVKSAMRTLDVIEFVVARTGGVAAQEIAASLAIPVSSLSYLLATLVDRAYLRRDGRRYHPGAGLDRLRQPAGEQSIVDRARPLVRALRIRLNETASLFLPVGWELEAAVTDTAEQTLRYSIAVGTRTPMHCIAAGKAFLAALPDDALHRYLEESCRERFTARSLVGADELMDEILAVREAGHAWTQDEYTLGISGMGVAIRAGGMPVAAVGVAVPSPRFAADARPRVVEEMLATARALE